MKILLATSKATPDGGGIASYNQELVNLLSKDNCIDLLTDSDEADIPEYNTCSSTFGKSIRDEIFCRSLVEKINIGDYDVIINSSSKFLPIIVPFLTTPIISVSHFVNGRRAIYAGYNAPYLSSIIALSNYGKEYLRKKFHINESSKIKVIYNFVKNDSNYQNKQKITHKPLSIVYPGGTSIQKSVDVVQHLVYKLIKSKLDFRFFWLGGVRLPSAKMSIFGLKTSKSLFPSDSRLIITDTLSREEAMEIIGNANIFLLPSRGEGCPMTLLEAMRAGCIPVVSDAHHGSREILELSGTGIITKQGSASSLFDAIYEIINNHELHISDYSKTTSYLNTELSEEKWAEKMNNVIAKSLKESKVVIPFTTKAFRKSYRRYSLLIYQERVKTILTSARYRIKFDWQYLKNKLGLIYC